MTNTNTDCATNATHGKFCWNELMTRDIERAKKFYRRHHRLDVHVDAVTRGRHLLGALSWAASRWRHVPLSSPQFDGVPECWMSYLAVDDVDKRTAKATSAGAKLMRPIFDVPNVGRIAILTEPGGAGVGWMTPAA